LIKFDENKTTSEATYIWYDKNRKRKYKKRRRVFGTIIEYGYEFYPDLFNFEHPWYSRLRSDGYTFDVTPFKDRSIPSFRIRRKK
jgi:hypothetical protein